MKKFNFIIGKRQIVIVALLVTLAVAAFLNWQFATGDQAVTVMDVGDKSSNNEEDKENKNNTQNYGEAELVNKNENNKSNFIKQAKLDRAASYDEEIENITKLMNSNNLTEEDKDKFIEQSMEIATKKENETTIENEIKSKDFVDDSIVYIENKNDSANAYVKAKSLNQDQITQITDIIKRITKFPASNIIVTPVK